MSLELKRITPEVTAQEALQSGQRPSNSLNVKEKSKVGRFIAAHNAKKSSAQQVNVVQLVMNAERAKPQLSAAEIAAAVAAAGGGVEASNTKKFFKQMYQSLFSEDEDFLNRDLFIFAKSLTEKSVSLVDSSKTLSQEQKVLRKYLLAEIGEGNHRYGDLKPHLFKEYKSGISAEEKKVIQEAIAAYSVSARTSMTKVGLREFVKAFAVLSPQEDWDTSEIIRCFKSYGNLLDAPDFIGQMVKVKTAMTDLLKRENIRSRKAQNRKREIQIASRINAVDLLVKFYLINKKFLDICSSCALQSLPKVGALVENCYQLIVAVDLPGGMNAIIKNAVQVKAVGKPAKNIFISNFNRLVLQSDHFKNIYKNAQHRQNVVDGIAKNTRAYAVLSASVSND